MDSHSGAALYQESEKDSLLCFWEERSSARGHATARIIGDATATGRIHMRRGTLTCRPGIRQNTRESLVPLSLLLSRNGNAVDKRLAGDCRRKIHAMSLSQGACYSIVKLCIRLNIYV